jgi:voltage-gated potassium channel Kch
MDNINRYVYRYLSAVVLVLIAGGTVFYHVTEKFSWVDSVYFCVVTLATVGYGDIVPKTDIGKLFTTFYIIVGVGVITTFFAATVRRRGATMRERHDKRNGEQ